MVHILYIRVTQWVKVILSEEEVKELVESVLRARDKLWSVKTGLPATFAFTIGISFVQRIFLA